MNFIQAAVAASIKQAEVAPLKERLVRLVKMLLAITTIIPNYTNGLEDVEKKLKEKGMKKENLGDLQRAIKEFSLAEEHYEYARQALMRIWEEGEHKKEIDDFYANTYGPLTDMIENACRCTYEGRYKDDWKYLAFIPQKDIKSAKVWYKQNHNGDGTSLEYL